MFRMTCWLEPTSPMFRSFATTDTMSIRRHCYSPSTPLMTLQRVGADWRANWLLPTATCANFMRTCYWNAIVRRVSVSSTATWKVSSCFRHEWKRWPTLPFSTAGLGPELPRGAWLSFQSYHPWHPIFNIWTWRATVCKMKTSGSFPHSSDSSSSTWRETDSRLYQTCRASITWTISKFTWTTLFGIFLFIFPPRENQVRLCLQPSKRPATQSAPLKSWPVNVILHYKCSINKPFDCKHLGDLLGATVLFRGELNLTNLFQFRMD